MSAPNRRLDLTRTNSICPPPETVLLESVKKNDVETIKTLINSNKSLFLYEYPTTKTILATACSEDGVSASTVQALLDLEADVGGNAEWKPLHLAAQNPNTAVLEVVLKRIKPEQINDTVDGNNALHTLVKSDVDDEMALCRNVELLLDAGIDVNQGDSKNLSAIFWAAKYGYRDIIKTMLENQKFGHVIDLDSHKLREKTARVLIEEKCLYDKPLPKRVQGQAPKDRLFSLIKQSKEDEFIRYFDTLSLTNPHDFVNLDDNSSTLLQYGCEKGLLRLVRYLLEREANVNLTTKNNERSPIEIVTENGYWEIFQQLLDQPELIIAPKILCNLLKKLDNPKFDKIDHEKCCRILLDKMESNKIVMDINGEDDLKNTPIHYSLRYADEEITKKLLKMGASLACKNDFGTMPIEDIKPEMLEQHLDDCIKFNLKNRNDEKRDFEVVFDYHSLMPPRRFKNKFNYDEFDPENCNTIEAMAPETEVIAYMSQTPEFKNLLKHPLIVSFLFMKWRRIRWLFYTNLLFYVMFVLSLLVYIFTYYINFDEEKSEACRIFGNISWVVLNLSFLVLILRELFQITVSPRNYLENFENLVELILIVITGLILYINSPTTDTRKQLSSVVILLAAFELVLMVGQHPRLSTNVVMLKTVSVNFFKLLLWYSLLIIAFALSFYVLFTNSGEAKAANKTDTDEEQNLFTGPGRSLFKTIVMLTGEFDAGSINFDVYPITSKLIFSMFVFMITIILLNLLNGLAVSDTQTIKNDAELVGHIARAQHIYYVESMLLGNIIPTSFVRVMQPLFCCFPCDLELTYTFFKPLARKVCLFTNSQNCQLCVLPNNYGKIYYEFDRSAKRKSSGAFVGCTKPCSDTYLDKETVRRTVGIVKRKRAEEDRGRSQSDFETYIQNLVKKALERSKIESF